MRSLPPGAIPWLNETDLLVCKIESCGQRAKTDKRVIDAGDAAALARDLTRTGTITLSDVQKSIVQRGLPDVVKYSGLDKEWWEKKLGLRRSPTPERSSPPRQNDIRHGGSDGREGSGRDDQGARRDRSRDSSGSRREQGSRKGSATRGDYASHGTMQASLQPIKEQRSSDSRRDGGPHPPRGKENDPRSESRQERNVSHGDKIPMSSGRGTQTREPHKTSRKPANGLSSGLKNLSLRS